MDLSKQIEKEFIKMFTTSFKINRNTEKCVFLNMAGHVDWITLKVCKSKRYFEYTEYNKDMILYRHDGVLYKDDEKRLQELQEINKELLKILKKQK